MDLRTAGMSTRSKSTVRLLVAFSVALLSLAVVGVAGGGVSGAATGPACTFSGQLGNEPIVTNVVAGQTVNVACTGLSDTTPYMLVEASLLLAIDPAAKPLLTGQVTSAAGLAALISALPELNASSEAFPISGMTGTLTDAYMVPSTQPTDPNATCPPSTEQFNSGLIGCVVVMINLTTFAPVTAGTFIIHYKTDTSLLPPNPTLALSTDSPKVGQTVTMSDAPGATTYWWMATLASLYALLDGGTAGPAPVTVKVGKKTASSTATVAPATYSDSVFTPPKLSGGFVVPKGRGKKTLVATLTGSLLGSSVSNSVTQTIRVHKK
jgi:hypothetical protein